MIDAAEEEPRRVSTIELFLDLVFVFAVTQLTALLAEQPDLLGLFQTLLIFGVVWWIYGGYVWLTNAVAPDTKSRRLLLLVAMLGFLLIALAIPTTFGSGGLVFGLGYLLVVMVHAVAFTRNADIARWTGILTIAPLNILSAVLILAGGVAGGIAQYPLMALALGVQVVTPFFVSTGQFSINTAHFVERYGLLVLIVLGESIVAIGVGLGTDTPLDLPLLTAAALALAITSVMWWIYFSGEDVRAEEAMEREPGRRARIAINAFFYATIPMLLGVVVFAAGVHFAIAHAFEPLKAPAALALAGGPALYVLGDVIFRLFVGAGIAWNRIVAAALALAAAPIGIAASAVAELALVWVILVVSVLAPAIWAGRAKRDVSHALE